MTHSPSAVERVRARGWSEEARYTSARTCCVASNVFVFVSVHAIGGEWLVAKFNVDNMSMSVDRNTERHGER